jgi:hypothetical protein
MQREYQESPLLPFPSYRKVHSSAFFPSESSLRILPQAREAVKHNALMDYQGSQAEVCEISGILTTSLLEIYRKYNIIKRFTCLCGTMLLFPLVSHHVCACATTPAAPTLSFR